MRGPDPFQLPIARKLHSAETFAEKRLWEQLRSRRLAGIKFVSQAPVGSFVGDFLCREQKLVIGIDGATHSAPEELARDRRRSAFLEQAGYRAVRFQNVEVREGMGQVPATIVETIKAHR